MDQNKKEGRETCRVFLEWPWEVGGLLEVFEAPAVL